MCSRVWKKREDETNENNETDEKFRLFRLFRYLVDISGRLEPKIVRRSGRRPEFRSEPRMMPRWWRLHPVSSRRARSDNQPDRVARSGGSAHNRAGRCRI